MSQIRTRWAAVGAAVAVTLGAGGIGLVDAAKETGDRPVYTAITTCRLMDTRSGAPIGDKATPFGPEETYTVDVWGDNGECTDIPDDVSSVQLNVTGVAASERTWLTFWPDGPLPLGSSLNPSPGEPPAPNAVTVDLSDAGSFEVYNFTGNVELVIDVVGIYQDHSHDDAYYTETEVDALTDEVFGFWNDDALADGSSEGVAVTSAKVGVYCVALPARSSAAGFQATAGTAGWTVAVDPTDFAGDCNGIEKGEDETLVVVYLNDAAGDPANGDFTFFAPASGPAEEPTPTPA